MSTLGTIGLIGNALGGGIEAYGAQVQSHKARKFAREQSATVYQRSVADMRAAGLNPNAIFGNGGGSPGAPAQGSFANEFAGASRLGDELGKAYTKGQEATALEAQARIAQSSAKAVESDTELKLAENSAYRIALNTDVGKVGAITQRYGSLGAVGEVMGKLGLGNLLGGESSSKSLAATTARENAINEVLERHAPRVPYFGPVSSEQRGSPKPDGERFRRRGK